MSTIQPTEVLLRVVAIAVGCAVTLRAARKSTPRARAFWRSLGVVCALVPCLLTAGESSDFRGVNEVAAFAGAVASGLLVGAFAVVRGLRGRRVGDHEYCRRCGFDLFGRPERTRVCGECGAPLDDATHAIVIGERRRRPQWLAFGGFVLAVTLGYLASSGRDVYRWATTADFSSYKPGAWLIDDALGRNVTVASRASKEIYDRLAAGTFGRANAGRYITRLLDSPPAPAKETPGFRFNVTYAMAAAEAAWAHDEVDEAIARRAMRAAIECEMFVAPQASRGRTLRFWIATGDFRTVRKGWAKATLSITNRVDVLDGRTLPTPAWSTLRGANERFGLKAFGNAFDLAGMTAPNGPATLGTQFTAVLTLALPGRPTLVETRDVTLSGTTTLVDASAMTCPPVVAAPSVAADGTIAPAATTSPVAPTPTLTIARSIDGTKRRVLNVRAPANGAILADVVLTTAGAERSLGTVFAEPNGDAELPFDDRPPGAYAIELRPTSARGADLFRPVPAFAVSVVVPSSAIADATGP